MNPYHLHLACDIENALTLLRDWFGNPALDLDGIAEDNGWTTFDLDCDFIDKVHRYHRPYRIGGITKPSTGALMQAATEIHVFRSCPVTAGVMRQRANVNENPYALPSNEMNGNRRLSAWAIQLCIIVAIIAALLYLPRLYLRSNGANIANEHQLLVQTICNYRAETGLLPYQLEDLQKRYKIRIPPHVYWSSVGVLDVRAGSPRISCVFGDDYEGWSSHWGDLSDAPIVPTVQQVTGERRVDAALTEYDRRINEYENDRWHRSAKMALLASLDRKKDVYTECVTALKEHPDWWRANFGVAMYAPDNLLTETESQFRQWVERTPGFVHWWCLAKYYRERGRHPDALRALQEAAAYPLEQVDDDAVTVPHGFAFDAASYASKQGEPSLVLALCDAWAKPKGVYNRPSPNLPAFRAAAFLNLGQRDLASAEFAKVIAESKERAICAGNLQQLGAAIEANDRTFVYDTGVPNEGFIDWSPFPRSEFCRITEP